MTTTTTTTTPVAEPIPTGLSDEEDAARHLALRLDPTLLFCISCETYYDSDKVEERVERIWGGSDEITRNRHCPRCDYRLDPVGTAPLTATRKWTK